MKLLMITGDRALAAGKHGAFYNTLEEFHKYWDRVDILCPNIKGRMSNVECLFENVFIHSSPWPLFLQPLWILKKGSELFRHSSFDLFTCHDYPPFYNGIGGWLLHYTTGLPYVLEIMHTPGYPRAAGFKEQLYKNIMRWFVRYDAMPATAIRVINERQTQEFLINAGVPKEKIKYIPASYIDLEVFRPTDVPKEYDMIFVGRLVKNKGADLFLEATRLADVKVAIIGSGPLENSLKQKARDYKLKIVFHGWAKNSTEIANLLNKSRLLVMPSYNEGGPRVVLEAMACGVPVLATAVGIVPDILSDKKSGRIIGWDAHDIARNVREILDDQTQYAQMRMAGLDIARQFEKETAIKNYADELKRFVG